MEIICTKCGSQLAANARFCIDCGSKVKIVFPEKTCPHCGHKWTPRTANPKTCSSCGYDLTKVSRLVIYAQDMGGYSMTERECAGLPKGDHCGLSTNLFMLVKFPDEMRYEPRCYGCLIDYMTTIAKENKWDLEEAIKIQ